MSNDHPQPLDAAEIPRFAGIPTFMRLPAFTDPAALQVGLIGVPWDGGTTNRAGARHGPREVRNLSSLMRKVHHVSRIAPYDLVRVGDLGDAPVNPIDLLDSLQQERGTAMILISHNMGVIAEHADRLYVMYLGRVVESGTTEQVFDDPRHPYTRKLLAAVPRADRRVERLETIDGSVPTPVGLGRRCGFASRCTVAIEGRCDTVVPALDEVEPGHHVRCFQVSDKEEGDHAWSDV